MEIMLILLIIITPVALAILVSLPQIVNFIKYLYKKRTSSEEDPELVKLKKIFEENSKATISISDLEKQPVFLIHLFKKIIKVTAYILLFPIMVFRVALMTRYGTAITWKLPFNLYEIWLILFVALSYYYSHNGYIIVGIILSSVVLFSIISIMISDFEVKDGDISLQKLPKHKIRLTSIIEYAIVVTLCFASLYYSASVSDTRAFSEPLTIFNSIYFSIITITTIGYGDITPVGWVSRSLVIAQSLFGFYFIIIFVSIFVSIWREKKLTPKEPK